MIPSRLFDFKSFNLLITNNVARFSILFILLLSFTFAYCLSIVSGILLVIAFPLGAITFNALWSRKVIESLPIFDVSCNSSHILGISTRKLETISGCGVCGISNCKRQLDSKKNQPWLGLNIPRDVDQAIQDLFNKILNEFITSWHSNFTKDDSFITELRRCLRYATSILLRRLLKADIGAVITNKLITRGLQHVRDYQNISKLATDESISIEEASVIYLNTKLHAAVHSRQKEIQYLRCLSEILMKHLIQESQLKCLSFNVLIRELLAGWVFLPLTDTLCNPFCVNSLILLALNYDPDTVYPDNSGDQVQFLHKFVVPNKDFHCKKSVLQLNLETILKNQKYLYAFMQFLKREGVVHFLQFCLHVEGFSKKILNPEMNHTEMESLYEEACDIFGVYFDVDGPSNIHFPSHIVDRMKEILGGGATNIVKLMSNPVLFEAYEVAYSNLEETYCPLFYLSDDYFLLLCGEKKTIKNTKGSTSSPDMPASPVKGRGGKKVMETSVVGKISSKFNKLLQFQAVEGRAYFTDVGLDLTEGECVCVHCGYKEADVLEVEAITESIQRDMSTWRVTVTCVTTKQENNSKPYSVFNINVIDIARKDNSLSKWSVERKLNDFYILQAKLAEFHGDFEDGTQLPPKIGMFSPRGSEYLENRRQLFEEYLQKLLQKPSLRGSDLLYFFLHSPVEFSSCLSGQYGIRRILQKSVEPIKLRKERGQKLDNFLNIFLSSTEGSKKSNKYEWKDVVVEEPRKKRDLTKSIFNNNFEHYLNKTKMTSAQKVADREILALMGPWDCILFTMSKLLGASLGVIQTVVTIKNLLGHSSDLFLQKLLMNKLASLMVSARISHLVRLLQDALFNSNHQPSKQGHKSLRERITKDVQNVSDNIFIRWFFPDFNEGIAIMVDSLQFPILNKHLCYSLLDEIVGTLFPEIAAPY